MEGLSVVIKCLLNADEVKESDCHVEPLLPQPESLLVQFSGRQVYSSTDAMDDRLTSNYWLSPSTADDNDGDVENVLGVLVPAFVSFTGYFKVPCDLSELCKQHLPPEISLIREVEKLCRISSTQDTEQGENKEKRNEQQKDKMKRPFGKKKPAPRFYFHLNHCLFFLCVQ